MKDVLKLGPKYVTATPQNHIPVHNTIADKGEGIKYLDEVEQN